MSRLSLGRCRRDRRGSISVEFAISGFAFCLLLLGAIDMGRYQITLQSLRQISEEAARVALVGVAANATNGCSAVPSQSTLATTVTSPNRAPMLNPSSLTITASCSTNASNVNTVTVTATYPFTFISPLLPSGQRTLSDRAAISF